MSIEALCWAKKQKVGDTSAKLLLIVLADYADEDMQCWPRQTTLCQDTELSERSVRAKLAFLEELGFIRRIGRWRKGGGRYSDLIELLIAPAAAESIPANPAAMGAYRQTSPVIPANPAGSSIDEPSLEPSLKREGTRGRAKPKRAHQLPEGWEPDDQLIEWAKERYPHVPFVVETEKFCDWARSKAAAKVDWRATWRNWIRNSAERYSRHDQQQHRAPRHGHGTGNGFVDLLSADAFEESRPPGRDAAEDNFHGERSGFCPRTLDAADIEAWQSDPTRTDGTW